MTGLDTPLEFIMTRELISLRVTDTLDKALKIFDHHSIHHIVVTDGSQGKLLGILSKADVLDLFIEPSNDDGLNLEKVKNKTVEDAMTADPVFLDPSDTIGLAADLVLSNKFHSLPIVEGEKIVGIVTSHDLLKFAFESIQPDDYSEYTE
ncbi:MAG: CBS domain-containing protein [Saprospirales bacterium]|nr:MAG: CBS domain-containing protein [Saprospirales bacterium]